MTPARIGSALLAVAIAAGFLAWSIQSSASTSLDTTLRLQTARVPDPDAAPPSIAENRRILDVLGESIEIREEVDSLLSDVEGVVQRLSRRQQAALELADRGRSELEEIGRALGGAARATRLSVARLADLRSSLGTSAKLARRIAEELEELDEKLGPGAGGRR